MAAIRNKIMDLYIVRKQLLLTLRRTTTSGSITSVGEERAKLSATLTCHFVFFCSERFPLPLGAWDGLHYFIVAFPEPSI